MSESKIKINDTETFKYMFLFQYDLRYYNPTDARSKIYVAVISTLITIFGVYYITNSYYFLVLLIAYWLLNSIPIKIKTKPFEENKQIRKRMENSTSLLLLLTLQTIIVISIIYWKASTREIKC